MIVHNLATRDVRFILLPFYMLAPIAYLWVVGRQCKYNLRVEGDLYKKHLDEVQRKAEQNLVVEVKTGEDRKRQELDKSTNGYKAAVISGLVR